MVVSQQGVDFPLQIHDLHQLLVNKLSSPLGFTSHFVGHAHRIPVLCRLIIPASQHAHGTNHGSSGHLRLSSTGTVLGPLTVALWFDDNANSRTSEGWGL